MTTIEVSTPPAEPALDERELFREWIRQTHWTDEAYLVLAEASNHLLELSEGRLAILPMPTLTHQRVARRFFKVVDAWLEGHRAGEALFAPHPIRLWPGKYREPDVMVWLDAHRDRMRERESGPPDLVLETLSSTTSHLDIGEKFAAYARAGIAEYWMADPQARRVSVFSLEGTDYKLLAHFGPGERARSQLLAGLEIVVDDLFDADPAAPAADSSSQSSA